MNNIHKNLAKERWYMMSLPEQLGNIGSEVGRARSAEDGNPHRFEGAVNRALYLFDLTLSDSRWGMRRVEVGRAREIFCDAITGGKEYNSKLADLEKYFMDFAIYARR